MTYHQDFLGCANRLRASMGEFEDRVTELKEVWRDSTGQEFQEQHLQPVIQVLRRMTLTLHEASELASRFQRALGDDD